MPSEEHIVRTNALDVQQQILDVDVVQHAQVGGEPAGYEMTGHSFDTRSLASAQAHLSELFHADGLHHRRRERAQAHGLPLPTQAVESNISLTLYLPIHQAAHL